VKWAFKERFLWFLCALIFHNIPHVLHIIIDGDILNPEQRVCALINSAKNYLRREKYKRVVIAISFH